MWTLSRAVSRSCSQAWARGWAVGLPAANGKSSGMLSTRMSLGTEPRADQAVSVGATGQPFVPFLPPSRREGLTPGGSGPEPRPKVQKEDSEMGSFSLSPPKLKYRRLYSEEPGDGACSAQRGHEVFSWGIQTPFLGQSQPYCELNHPFRDPVRRHPAQTHSLQPCENPWCTLTDRSYSAAQRLLSGSPRTRRALPQGTSDDW